MSIFSFAKDMVDPLGIFHDSGFFPNKEEVDTSQEDENNRLVAEINQLQIDAINESKAFNEMMRPILMEQAGLKPVYGNQAKLQELQQQREQIIAQDGGTEDQGSLDANRQQRDQLNQKRNALPNGPQKQALAGQIASLDAQYKQLRSQSPLFEIDAQIAQAQEGADQITGYEEILDPLDEKRDQIEGALLDKEIAALSGDAPVGPGLLRDLDKRDQDLENKLKQQFGDLTSSPAQEALQRSKDSRTAIIDQAKRGDLTLAHQLAGSSGLFDRGGAESQYNRAMGLGGASNAFPGLYSQAGSSILSSNQPFQFNRALDANKTNPFGAIAGTVVGAAAGSMFGPAGTSIGAQAGSNFGQELFGRHS